MAVQGAARGLVWEPEEKWERLLRRMEAEQCLGVETESKEDWTAWRGQQAPRTWILLWPKSEAISGIWTTGSHSLTDLRPSVAAEGEQMAQVWGDGSRGERLSLGFRKDAGEERNTCIENPRVCRSSESHPHMQVRGLCPGDKGKRRPQGDKGTRAQWVHSGGLSCV